MKKRTDFCRPQADVKLVSFASSREIGGQCRSARTMPEHTLAWLRVASCGHRKVPFAARHLVAVAAIEICFGHDIDAPCVDRDVFRVKTRDSRRPLSLWDFSPGSWPFGQVCFHQRLSLGSDRLKFFGIGNGPVATTEKRHSRQRGKHACYVSRSAHQASKHIFQTSAIGACVWPLSRPIVSSALWTGGADCQRQNGDRWSRTAGLLSGLRAAREALA